MNVVDQVRWAHGCERPIALRGAIQTTSVETGQTQHWSTDALPNGVAYVACKNRRVTRCQPCSYLYQGDAYQLISSGLRGGKGVSESVGSHPALFVTFTAPGFGPTHGTRDGAACHPRRNDEHCPHGKPVACWAVHTNDDEMLGQPLCSDCFDYKAAVLWNAHGSALWRVTRIGIERSLATLIGIPVRNLRAAVRTEYVRVAEFQKRGLVHFHVAIRLDGVDANPPPAGCTTDILAQAVRQAAKQAGTPLPDGSKARWGAQLDISPITVAGTQSALSRGQAAGYLAKYATKGTEHLGALDHRLGITDIENIENLRVNAHLAKMVTTSWDLQASHPKLNIAPWSHQLGFPGHFCTKSNNWSTTFGALRSQRAAYLNEKRPAPFSQAMLPQEKIIDARWSFVGRGYRDSTAVWIAGLIRDRHNNPRAA